MTESEISSRLEWQPFAETLQIWFSLCLKSSRLVALKGGSQVLSQPECQVCCPWILQCEHISCWSTLLHYRDCQISNTLLAKPLAPQSEQDNCGRGLVPWLVLTVRVVMLSCQNQCQLHISATAQILKCFLQSPTHQNMGVRSRCVCFTTEWKKKTKPVIADAINSHAVANLHGLQQSQSYTTLLHRHYTSVHFLTKYCNKEFIIYFRCPQNKHIAVNKATSWIFTLLFWITSVKDHHIGLTITLKNIQI